MNFADKLITIIEQDEWMLTTLTTVQQLNLYDCWIGAGFVRNKVWDYLHDQERTPLNDIDVIYFNPDNISKDAEVALEQQLKAIDPSLNWSVKNQARMHLRHQHPPYTNCKEAITFWPETATSVAVRLNSKNKIEYLAPCGLADLFNLIVTPTPTIPIVVFNNRVTQKGWKETWPKLRIVS